MASIPPFPGRDRNEAVLRRDELSTEGGPASPSDFPPRWRHINRAVDAMYTGVRLGQSNKEIMDAIFLAAEGDAEAVNAATNWGREIAYYGDSADRPGRYGVRPSREQAALLDREAVGANHLGRALMAAPYEAAKWVEMNTPLKPLSLIGQTVSGRNRKLDTQLEGLGLPTSQVLAMYYLNNSSDDPWAYRINETTSKPSVDNVIAALAGGKRQLENKYAERSW